jgi:hypothetical protein
MEPTLPALGLLPHVGEVNMDAEQYDLVLFLMGDMPLRHHRDALRAAQRVERHRPDGDPAGYDDELRRIDLELARRREDDEPPF